jgi:hypothetical protein
MNDGNTIPEILLTVKKLWWDPPSRIYIWVASIAQRKPVSDMRFSGKQTTKPKIVAALQTKHT